MYRNQTYTKYYNQNKFKNNFEFKKMVDPLELEIISWVLSIKDIDDDVEDEIYYKNKINEIKEKINNWEYKKDVLLKSLTRNYKWKILDWVLKNIKTNNDLLEQKQQKNEEFTLLNECVWRGKDDIPNPKFDSVIKTFLTLIDNGINFISLSSKDNSFSNKNEIENLLKEEPYRFYKTLLKKDKIFPSELQNNLFCLITGELNLKTPDLFVREIQNDLLKNDFVKKNLEENVLLKILNMINKYFEKKKHSISKI